MTLEQLLLRIQSLIFFNGKWHARARGSEKFHSAHDPRSAIHAALSIYEDDDL